MNDYRPSDQDRQMAFLNWVAYTKELSPDIAGDHLKCPMYNCRQGGFQDMESFLSHVSTCRWLPHACYWCPYCLREECFGFSGIQGRSFDINSLKKESKLKKARDFFKRFGRLGRKTAVLTRHNTASLELADTSLDIRINSGLSVHELDTDIPEWKEMSAELELSLSVPAGQSEMAHTQPVVVELSSPPYSPVPSHEVLGNLDFPPATLLSSVYGNHCSALWASSMILMDETPSYALKLTVSNTEPEGKQCDTLATINDNQPLSNHDCAKRHSAHRTYHNRRSAGISIKPDAENQLDAENLGLTFHTLEYLWMGQLDDWLGLRIFPARLAAPTRFHDALQILEDCLSGNFPTTLSSVFSLVHLSYACAYICHGNDTFYAWDTLYEDVLRWAEAISDQQDRCCFLTIAEALCSVSPTSRSSMVMIKPASQRSVVQSMHIEPFDSTATEIFYRRISTSFEACATMDDGSPPPSQLNSMLRGGAVVRCCISFLESKTSPPYPLLNANGQNDFRICTYSHCRKNTTDA